MQEDILIYNYLIFSLLIFNKEKVSCIDEQAIPLFVKEWLMKVYTTVLINNSAVAGLLAKGTSCTSH